MLLVHQTGSVKLGEVVRCVPFISCTRICHIRGRRRGLLADRLSGSSRYTLTYTPSQDRVLPPPLSLHVRIRNTSPAALRVAYLRGPYTIYVAAYPTSFNPNRKVESPRQEGVPQFEPEVKAGSSWSALLSIPEDIRPSTTGVQDGDRLEDVTGRSVSWIIEIASQVIFSANASVGFELLVGRDEASLSLSANALGGKNGGTGQLQDHQQSHRGKHDHHRAQPKGIFSKAISLTVDDTESIWKKPAFPEWEEGDQKEAEQDPDPNKQDVALKNSSETVRKGPPKRKQRKVHLVILTHGLHSNIGADMLYLKENIDEAARQAREDWRRRKANATATDAGPVMESGPSNGVNDASASLPGSSEAPEITNQTIPIEDEDDYEQVIVRGFNGNAGHTERGVKYLGKRMARDILMFTHPDQTLPHVRKSLSRSVSSISTGHQQRDDIAGGSVLKQDHHPKTKGRERAYKVTSISFIGHSLGGLVQTYAIGYIHKHSPHFFDEIQPINFVALAAPFLGLSNENPIYVKFALSFGLVGRTGQDLGLHWRAPEIARSGWDALIGGIGDGPHRQNRDPGAKPLLRTLPTGHSHDILKRFRNRTVYANVVNDGIVPLRTSCLLFLDWRGIGKVEKARRENGLMAMAGWGWSQLTGERSSSNARATGPFDGEDEENESEGGSGHSLERSNTVPQPPEGAIKDMPTPASSSEQSSRDSFDHANHPYPSESTTAGQPDANKHAGNPFSAIMTLFKPQGSNNHHQPAKQERIYKRSQTLLSGPGDGPDALVTPPRTSFLEAAGDTLNPPLPCTEFLIDPSSRPETIFHDRVYHPEDIPPRTRQASQHAAPQVQFC